MQLFPPSELPQNEPSALARIKGLQYIPDYITVEEEASLWEAIQNEQWLDDLKRRVQHYGYKYNYKARFVDYSMKINDLPDWAMPLAERFQAEGFIQNLAEQLIVNEYVAGQGIARHIDCAPCFGDTIISLSLGSACIMDFADKISKDKLNLLIAPRSLVIMKGESRYQWTHGIAARKTDVFLEQKFERSTRISLTFRNILLS